MALMAQYPKTTSDLKRTFEREGLADYWNRLEAVILPTAYMELHPVSEKEELSLKMGITRLGGFPDMPNDWEWPANRKKKALSFIAQVNLAELSAVEVMDHPKSGVVYFFYNALDMPMGYDPKHITDVAVLYFNGDLTQLKRREPPKLKRKDVFACDAFYCCRADFVRAISLPTEIDDIFEMEDAEHERYCGLANPDIRINKMFGYPNALQSPMEEECELVSRGVYCGDEDYEMLSDQERKSAQENWLCLLQIDSNRECEMSWGDKGRLYFWITRQDGLARNLWTHD